MENLFADAVEHGTGVPAKSVDRPTTGERPRDDHLIDGETGSDFPSVTAEPGGTDDGFYVADDGRRIPPAERDRIFEPGETSGENGTGLGVTREMIDAHDWDVRATESAAGGARFEITGVELADEADAT